MTFGQEKRLRTLAKSPVVGGDIKAAMEEIDRLRVIMRNSDELRNISKEIVNTEAGGLKASQYWGLRLRLIADAIDGIKINKDGYRPVFWTMDT